MPPRKATMKMLMTRPRISSGAISCASETSVEVRMIERDADAKNSSA